jgi:phospholipid/cholesterol/gamma-HCH transport system substrate-binding protein
LQNSAKATKEFPLLLQNGQHAMQEFTMQTLPAANRSIANINTITTNLSVTTDEIKQNPAILIRGRTQRPLGPGE